MKPSESRIRVVLTDGERTADFAWLRHAGRQVVCGIPEDEGWHMTYPEDGRFHITLKKGPGHRRAFVPQAPVPLDGFSGQQVLLALGIGSVDLTDAALRPFERKPQDAVAFLDLRAFGDALVWTELGLIEVGKTDQLHFDFEVQQVLLVRSIAPWVYVAAGIRDQALTR